MIEILESGVFKKNGCRRVECVVYFEHSQFISTVYEIKNFLFVFSKNATTLQPSNLFNSLKMNTQHNKRTILNYIPGL